MKYIMGQFARHGEEKLQTEALHPFISRGPFLRIFNYINVKVRRLSTWQYFCGRNSGFLARGRNFQSTYCSGYFSIRLHSLSYSNQIESMHTLNLGPISALTFQLQLALTYLSFGVQMFIRSCICCSLLSNSWKITSQELFSLSELFFSQILFLLLFFLGVLKSFCACWWLYCFFFTMHNMFLLIRESSVAGKLVKTAYDTRHRAKIDWLIAECCGLDSCLAILSGISSLKFCCLLIKGTAALFSLFAFFFAFFL